MEMIFFQTIYFMFLEVKSNSIFLWYVVSKSVVRFCYNLESMRIKMKWPFEQFLFIFNFDFDGQMRGFESCLIYRDENSISF